MDRGKRLSLSERWEIVAAHGKGQTAAALAKEYNVSRWTIYRLLRHYQETGRVTPEFSRCGRKPSLSESQLASVQAALTADPNTNMKELHQRLHLPCGLRTLYNIAKRMGIEPAEPHAQEAWEYTAGNVLPIWKGREYIWH